MLRKDFLSQKGNGKILECFLTFMALATAGSMSFVASAAFSGFSANELLVTARSASGEVVKSRSSASVSDRIFCYLMLPLYAACEWQVTCARRKKEPGG